MDDFVKELRDWAHIADNIQGVAKLVMLSGEIFTEAADEIEQLRIGYQQATNELERATSELIELRALIKTLNSKHSDVDYNE